MFGYTRVSTDEQADSRNGLEAQRDTVDSEARRRGWTVEHFADEGVSGKAIGPKLREVLQLLASGQGDGLVVAKLDRLSRSIVNAANIIEAAQARGWSLGHLGPHHSGRPHDGDEPGQLRAIRTRVD
jgi:DNA invertase Pin-like site-specific DNA recombinase